MATWRRFFDASADPVASSLTPDSPDTAERGVLSSASLRRGILFFVLVGVFARVMRYALRFPLWDDESFLCVNFISRGYAELLRPLDYHQVAPILFLWIERTAARLFGFSELVLRLFPFVCSIASVFLFRKTASRLLSGLGLFVAVAIFSVSYPGIRYAAEAKPYGSDLFVSLGLLFLTVEWLERRESRWLWWLACLTPLAIGLSYPAVFAARRIQPRRCRLLVEARRHTLRMACVERVEPGPGRRIWFLFLAQRPRAGGGGKRVHDPLLVRPFPAGPAAVEVAVLAVADARQ